ncbi:hypothetical protein LguiA_018977 [Lonicera macranthoides]
MLIARGLAGMASWICCYPLDVIKTRVQAQSPSSIKYHSIVDCFCKSLYGQRGCFTASEIAMRTGPTEGAVSLSRPALVIPVAPPTRGRKEKHSQW